MAIFANEERRRVYAWALYDWANSTFATTVMAGFFPIFFKDFWSVGSSPAESTLRLGAANSISSLIVFVLAPILGAIADSGGTRKRFLGSFLVLGVLTTGALPLVASGEWLLASLLYVLAIIGFAGGNVFYDALLVAVSSPDRRERVSALGFGLGYLGGGLLFAVNVLMTLRPEWFGLPSAAAAVRWSFLMVAVWWLVFSIPLFIYVPEPAPAGGARAQRPVMAGLAQFRETFRHIRALRTVFLFLLAYWLYIDGVDTIVRMAVDYGLVLGFDPGSLVSALLLTQFVGFPAAILFGRLGERYGAKAGIQIGLLAYIGGTIWAFHMDSIVEFYALAVLIGLVQGGVQALSRSLYSRLIPQDKAAEFFGFYNMLGKFAAVIGPIMVGWIGVMAGHPRYGILSVVILFVLGGAVLHFVRIESPARESPPS
jgi:UMF1 family MFS transporter